MPPSTSRAAAAAGAPPVADVVLMGNQSYNNGLFDMSTTAASGTTSSMLEGSLFSTANETWSDESEVDAILKEWLRPANILMTNVQIGIMFWVLGMDAVNSCYL
jgi:hypothetical protein